MLGGGIMETSKTLDPKGPDVGNPLRMTPVVRVQAAFGKAKASKVSAYFLGFRLGGPPTL